MPSMNDVLGVIMGGGKGSRLHPLTEDALEACSADRRQISSH